MSAPPEVTRDDWQEDAAGAGPDASQVADLFALLEKTVRAHRLYQANNPVYQGFLGALRGALSRLWEATTSLQVAVEDGAFGWQGNRFSVGEGRDSLAFLFYKDGIRALTLLPGFEDEVGPFLEIVHRARQRDDVGDDLVTLLWEQEFTGFQYTYVDVLGEDYELPEGWARAEGGTASVDLARIVADAEGRDGEPPRPSALRRHERTEPAPEAILPRDSLVETLYFLDQAELALLQREVDLEWTRDVRGDVITALVDRLEDPVLPRQREILGVFRQLIPSYLAMGDLASASRILVELNGLYERSQLAGPAYDECGLIFRELSDPAVVAQLVQALEDGVLDPAGDELGAFLQHLGPTALAVLLRTVETTEMPGLRKRLEVAVETIARTAPEPVVALLGSDDPAIAAGAAHVLGRLGHAAAAAGMAALLGRESPSLRLAAVEALVAIHNGVALDAVQRALQDADRDVRVAAARGLARLRYQPARARLEQLILGRSLRDADLTEKIAFFEAYGAVGAADSVGLLDRLLNGRNLVRRHQPPELRACAALALGRVGTGAARAALEKALADDQPMVRNAVARALRQEAVAS